MILNGLLAVMWAILAVWVHLDLIEPTPFYLITAYMLLCFLAIIEILKERTYNKILREIRAIIDEGSDQKNL